MYRRPVTALALGLLVAVPLFPEVFGLGGVSPFAQLTAFRPQGIAVIAVVAALALIRRTWRLYGALGLALAVVAGGLVVPRVLSSPDDAPAGTTTLTVMGANVLGGGADAGRVAEVIRERRPAFVSLPEAQVDVRQRIEVGLSGLGYRGYTFQSSDAPVSATSVLVSPELGGVTFDTGRGATEFGHVFVTGGTLGRLRLVAYHSYPPMLGSLGVWKRDLEAVGSWCSEGIPTIIAGDFNATVDHGPFRQALGSSCRSVAPAVGEGLQGTWPSDRPAALRTQIDHVVVTNGLAPIDFTSYDILGSDHRAVVARLAV